MLTKDEIIEQLRQQVSALLSENDSLKSVNSSPYKVCQDCYGSGTKIKTVNCESCDGTGKE